MKYGNVIIMREINKIHLLRITIVTSTKGCNMDRKLKCYIRGYFLKNLEIK